MMALDLGRWARLRTRMDDNQAELMRLLYTRIGMIMEDASVVALSLGSPKSTFDAAKVEELSNAIRAISALMDAIHALGE